jgi:hypothetical protein
VPLEALRHDVTPSGLHHLLIHFDIPPEPADWKLRIRFRRASLDTISTV